MGPLDMCLLGTVVFAVIKIVQFWIVWELEKEE